MVRKNKFLILSSICLIGIYFFIDLFNPRSKVNFTPDLIIYTYSSFAAKWGPGPYIKKKFEEQCRCKLEFRETDDSRVMIQKLTLEGEKVLADIVIGINQWDLIEAEEQLGFSREFWPTEMNLSDAAFKLSLGAPGELVPFDWGILAFNTKANSPLVKAKNLKEFLALLPDKSLVLQDPRTSAPGLSLLNWLVYVLGEDAAFDYLKKLNDKIYTITSSWSSSYGLFQKNQAQAVFSYVTSPIYHLVEENDSNYKALSFEEGLPTHVEFAGVLKRCLHCDRAKDFIRFLLSPEIQIVLMKKNYMFPIDPQLTQNTPWAIQDQYKKIPHHKLSKETQARILERWTQWSKSR